MVKRIFISKYLKYFFNKMYIFYFYLAYHYNKIYIDKIKKNNFIQLLYVIFLVESAIFN